MANELDLKGIIPAAVLPLTRDHAIDEGELRNRIKNKMIRPTTIPHLLEDLKIEQAIAREALRLAMLMPAWG